ncbi:MAG TPA: response regulator transcription factor [Anaerolineaceae bacterium]|nr:response regulator transcription factor [Anaerolineaceae bacterium]
MTQTKIMRVLLVDDHSLFLEGLSNLLATDGIEVVGVAHDGFDALVQARRFQPDVILMDIHMPNCDGVAATRLIKASIPQVKIIMLTMSENEQDLFEAVKSGASGYLLKSLKAAEFFDYLAELQAGHPPFSAGLAEKILREFAQRPSQSQPQHEADGQGIASIDGTQSTLSPRQIEILTLVAQGQTYLEVAQTICISERTVKYHMAEILRRLHLQNRTQVITYAARIGLSRANPE